MGRNLMISTGIVVEYNPFHNGHALHLQKSKEKTGSDVVIAVMSGNFLQRGEPAIVNKFARTQMALMAGIDIVVELPYAFATQKAETFAKGAVQLLSALGCDYLCFGSEAGSIDTFHHTGEFMCQHEDELNRHVRYFMEKGYSYPKANALAFQKLNPPEDILDLSKPNNILGYHYMKEISKLPKPMTGMTIKRENSGYHDEELSDTKISSATSIRKAIFTANSLEDVISSIPESTLDVLKEFLDEYHTFIEWENYWQLLKYRLIHSEPEELREIYEMVEGLENRLIQYAKLSNSFKEFIEQVKTKRYTWTRIQRICTHILTNAKRKEMLERSNQAEYIRLLGMNSKGREYIRERKDEISLPIIAKLSAADPTLIRLDVKAGQVYSFGFPESVTHKIFEAEYKQPPIILDYTYTE